MHRVADSSSGSDCFEVQDFVVISEESIAKGVRRVVAVAGEAAISARSELRDVCVSQKL